MDSLSAWLGVGGGLLLVLALTLAFVHAARHDRRAAAEAAVWIDADTPRRSTPSFGDDERLWLGADQLALRELALAVVLWDHLPDRSSAAVRAAEESLALGLDSPALRELAGLSRSHQDHREIRHLAQRALDELDTEVRDPSSEEARLLALGALCSEWMLGLTDIRAVSAWAHAQIGHTGAAVAQELVELDDLLDEGTSPVDARATVVEYLERVAGLSPVGHRGRGAYVRRALTETEHALLSRLIEALPAGGEAARVQLSRARHAGPAHAGRHVCFMLEVPADDPLLPALPSPASSLEFGPAGDSHGGTIDLFVAEGRLDSVDLNEIHDWSHLEGTTWPDLARLRPAE